MPVDERPAEVLELLRTRHNVLISGPPGTGKSRLLGELEAAFLNLPVVAAGPVHVPGARAAIPATPPAPPPAGWLPSPGRTDRKVFRTVFHQNTKHRDFVSGLVPSVGGGGDSLRFEVQVGALLSAAEHALTENGASLLIIDEINRGPAVQVFGGVIVAMEGDKRLDPTGARSPTTQTFDLVLADGTYGSMALPHHLYIVGAMNQADVSVEALDVAFLRRWTPFHLAPQLEVLCEHFGLPQPVPSPPDDPTTGLHVYAAACGAWAAVNRRITIGRGREFQVGHGVLMGPTPPATVSAALAYVKPGWEVVRAHVEEVFFGDVRGVAAAYNLEAPGHPLSLETHSFADQPRLVLTGNASPSGAELYGLLKAVAG